MNDILFPTPSVAIVVTPHPDDSEIGCGGTIAKWIREGAKVIYLLCTNGDKGTSDNQMTSDRLASIRAEEQLKAAAVLGVEEVISLGYPDGALEDSPVFRGQIVRAIRKYKPDVLLCTDPVRVGFYLHRDHRICGIVSLDALYPFARDRLHYPEHESEGLAAHKTPDALLWGTEAPDTFIDISETIEVKVAALSEHKSQFPLDLSDADLGESIKDVAMRAGQEIGIRYAESFRRVSFGR